MKSGGLATSRAAGPCSPGCAGPFPGRGCLARSGPSGSRRRRPDDHVRPAAAFAAPRQGAVGHGEELVAARRERASCCAPPADGGSTRRGGEQAKAACPHHRTLSPIDCCGRLVPQRAASPGCERAASAPEGSGASWSATQAATSAATSGLPCRAAAGDSRSCRRRAPNRARARHDLDRGLHRLARAPAGRPGRAASCRARARARRRRSAASIRSSRP